MPLRGSSQRLRSACIHACTIVAALAGLGETAAHAEETSIILDGVVPQDGPAVFQVEFEVPTGIIEIEVRHTDGSDTNILDWGLAGPDGFRGWGGGNEEPAIVGEDAASRSYAPGPIEPGTWSVWVGKARVETDPATYELEVLLRDEVTLAPQPERQPYAETVLRDQPGWYAGDLHVHSFESGDARPPLGEIAAYARSRGLDFVEITDHNIHTAADFMVAAQAAHPDLLLLPGVEFTTYRGHGNGIGATQWADFRVGPEGATIEDAANAYRDQGALFAVNHPVLDLGPLCIGCAWEHDLDPALIDAVELTNGGGLQPFGWMFIDAAIAYWDELCAQGHHVAPIAGSDDHKAGVDLNQFQSPIGDGTTMVQATALSHSALVEGIRAGRTVVKLQGPEDPMVVLDAADGREGDTVRGAEVELTAELSGAPAGSQVRWVVNGVREAPIDATEDPFTFSRLVDAPASGQDRYRVEVLVDGSLRVLTSHLWVEFAETATGGDESSTGQATTGSGDGTTTGPPELPPSSSSGDGSPAQTDEGAGCGCQGPSEPATPRVLAALLGLALVFRRR